MLNKLGHYIFKRICKDQEVLRKKQAMNMYGLYVRPKDIQTSRTTDLIILVMIIFQLTTG